MKLNPRPVAVYLTVEGLPEQHVATFYNETSGFSAFAMARKYARWRQGEWTAKQLGWHWRFARVSSDEP